LISPTANLLSQRTMPPPLRGEGMTDSPTTRGLSTRREPGLGAAQEHPNSSVEPSSLHSFSAFQQRAPIGDDVKDLRPLRGRPPGAP
jgi:hypothetical protein